ncbi:Hypothetical predicted protein [Octopus vulgaris]|uniref:ATP-dependent DNA helicase PIF1-like n=1 Tax=Octopus vulgaris TaxID=6645 RepID=A0AA36FCG7_OCTVU|nr:Hypothetical predicted protein [Octopus vulgaris]
MTSKLSTKKKGVQTGLINVAISTEASDTGGLREVVSVAVSARVMIPVNIDVSDGLANGICGTDVGIDNTGSDVHTILVKFNSERVGKQAIADNQYKKSFPGVVPIKRLDVQFYTGRGRRSVEAKRSQFPLSLAWGCTIHKVQGKIMDKIVVAMQGKGSFMPGQEYFALSRVRHLSGLFLLGFDVSAIRTSTSVVREMDRLRQQTLSETLPSAAPTVTHG